MWLDDILVRQYSLKQQQTNVEPDPNSSTLTQPISLPYTEIKIRW